MDLSELVRKIGNVDFELTYLCNLNCMHCYNPTHAKSIELPKEQVQAITEQVKNAGFQEIHFNGGEPLIRKDIYAILIHSGNLGMRTILETNAIILSEPECLTRIEGLVVRAGIDGPVPVHGGFAIGVERIILKYLQLTDISDVIPYGKKSNTKEEELIWKP